MTSPDAAVFVDEVPVVVLGAVVIDVGAEPVVVLGAGGLVCETLPVPVVVPVAVPLVVLLPGIPTQM